MLLSPSAALPRDVRIRTSRHRRSGQRRQRWQWKLRLRWRRKSATRRLDPHERTRPRRYASSSEKSSCLFATETSSCSSNTSRPRTPRAPALSRRPPSSGGYAAFTRAWARRCRHGLANVPPSWHVFLSTRPIPCRTTCATRRQNARAREVTTRLGAATNTCCAHCSFRSHPL